MDVSFIYHSQYGEKYKSLDYQIAIYLMTTCCLYCKMLAALAFRNPDEVTDAFEELNEDLERLQLDEEMQILYDYFENTYIGRQQRRGRRIP